MALNLAPTAIFPSWSSNGTTITLARTDLFELTASACHPVTGDARAVVLAVLKTLQERYTELAEQPLAVTFRYSPGRFVDSANDAFFEKVLAEFRFNFYVIFPEETIAPEPV